MTIQNESDMLVKLALVSQQVNVMSGTVNEIKTTIMEFATLDKKLAELMILQQQQLNENTTQWQKIDATAEAAIKANEKVDAWVNKGRGAWATLAILGGVVQVAVIAAVTYMFTHLRTTEDNLLLLNHRVIQLEEPQRPKVKP